MAARPNASPTAWNAASAAAPESRQMAERIPAIGDPAILQQARDLLLSMYVADEALFAPACALEGARITTRRWPLRRRRYSIIALLGLLAWQQHFGTASDGRDAQRMTADFLARHGQRVRDPGDRGLLLLLLSELGHNAAAAHYDAIDRDFAGRPALNLQDIAWLAVGAETHERRTGTPASVSRRLADLLLGTDFRHAGSGWPMHRPDGHRRDMVSFGAICYRLWALATLADRHGLKAEFAAGTDSLISAQRSDGGWPWFFHAPSGTVIDPYPLFSVHQDAMAPMFLLPAWQAGIPGAEDALRASLRWLDGNNDLRQAMLRTDPFFIYRGIARAERPGLLRRYLRGRRYRPGDDAPVSSLKLDTNCRAYHLGWLLYVWSRNQAAWHQLTA
jgi:hypothetical protein